MEKDRSGHAVTLKQFEESSTFICTECGDGFITYSNLLKHIVVHGPLESFPLDGSSNGFEVAREYVLQENGTLAVVNGSARSQPTSAKPGSFWSELTPEVKPMCQTHVSNSNVDAIFFEHKQATAELKLNKPHDDHFCCEKCCKSFNSLLTLQRHQQYGNTDCGFKCTLCCKIFKGRQDLKLHLQDHAQERFYCCAHCGKRFVKVDALYTHQKENHQSVKFPNICKMEEKERKKLEKTYHCKRCKLQFFWMSDYQTHSLYQCKGKEPVSICESTIEMNSSNTENTQQENSPNHGSVANVHQTDEDIFKVANIATDVESSFTPYRCGLCGDCFQNLNALKEHHVTHQGQEGIDQINQDVQTSWKQKVGPRGRRRRGNTNGKLHPCKHCHRVFNHSSSLSRHMRYHKGTMHTCVFCGRHFPQRCDMRRHVALYHKLEAENKLGVTPSSISTVVQNGSAVDSVQVKFKNSSDDEPPVTEESLKAIQCGKPGRTNYVCQECGKRFGLLCVYQRHLRYHKKEPSEIHKCLDFPAEPTKSSPLLSHAHHRRNHKEGAAVGLTVVKPTTGDTTVLQKTNVLHAQDDAQSDRELPEEPLYECTECTEMFLSIETFLQHQTSHDSENTG